MPLYEYVCESDDQVIELMRPMDQADAPVEDPEGLGRTFSRRLSTFSSGSSGSEPAPGGCPCGNPQGPCSMG